MSKIDSELSKPCRIEEKKSRTQVNGKSFSLSFRPHNFHFPKSTKTSVHTPPCCWQGTGRSARRHPSSQPPTPHCITRLITDIVKLFPQDFFHVSFYIVHLNESSNTHVVTLSHLPNRFHLEVPVIFSHHFSASTRCKVSGRGAPSALRMGSYHKSRCIRPTKCQKIL